jgi:hypothetical protein
MKVFNRKSQLQRVVETVGDVIDVASRSTSNRPKSSGGRFKLPVPGGSSARTRKVAVPKDKAKRAGLVAGGLAGLTAGSAGVSSLRRRKEGARGDS